MKIFISFLFVWGATATYAWAAGAPCEGPKTYQDLIRCVDSKSIAVKNALLEIDRSKALVDSASQWQNPEFSAESYHGSVAGQTQSETDLSIGIPISLGGKVSARKNLARGGLGLAEAQLYEARAKAKSQIILKLHRLRQVMHEQEIAEEAIKTFGKLIVQFQKRPGLSPEQQISHSVYQLTKSEYELKKNETLDEILRLDSFFKLNLGLSVAQIKNILPQSLGNWPRINPSRLHELSKRLSPEEQILKAELESAKAEFELAQSEAWPSLTLGPSLKLEQQGGRSNSTLGLNLNFSLPVLNLNKGAREAALAGVKRQESLSSYGRQAQDLRREELQKIYEHSVISLKQSLSHDGIEKRHKEAEKLFSRGVVPSSLVIETHRTLFELEKTRHERELRALEALLEIHTLDGNILEVLL